MLVLFGIVSFFNKTLKSGNRIQLFRFSGQNCYDVFQSVRLKASFVEGVWIALLPGICISQKTGSDQLTP